MKKFTLSFVLLLTTVLGISATETTIWEGPQAGNLDFTVGTDLHTLLVNNLKAGDVVNISYTGATEGNKLYVQDSSWDSYPNSMIGITTDVLTAGSGVFQFTASQEFINKLKTDGLKLRRASDPTYSFTKVTVSSGESGGEQGGGEQGGGATGTITIWEGTSTESIYMAPESDLYNKMIGDGSTQANLSVGDKIKFYYTGAAADTQIWLQANWDGLSGEGSMPSITGDGSCEFYINAADLASIKTSGLRFRIGQGSCTFTKIEVIKNDANVAVPGDDETILWSGSVKASSGKAFRYGDERANFINALSVGKYLHVYMSNVVEGNQIYFKDVTTWGWINEGQINLTAEQQIYTFQVTQDMIDKVNVGSGDYGLLIQGKSTDEYEIRFVTISDSENTGIQRVENTFRPVGVAYNLQGQRVSVSTKGLIIINGKKFLNK